MAIIGIDLGTSNSAAAVLRGGRPVSIPGAEGVTLGGKAFPSYVAITADGQMLVGEPARRQTAVNTSLGEFRLDGLPPAPRGVPKVEITFDIDASGILNVTARDQATGNERSLRITGSARLSEPEKRCMVEEAERYTEQDRKRREDAETLNAADSLYYQAERALADFGARLGDDLRPKLESALREALGQRPAALASQRAGTLKTILQEVGKTVYAQAAPPGPQPRPDVGAPAGEARPNGSGPDGRVVDAEYQEARPR